MPTHARTDRNEGQNSYSDLHELFHNSYISDSKLISPFLIGISMMDPEKRKKECMTKFDGVYMNEKSYDCAKLAVGSAIGIFLLQFKAWVSCLWREL